jgi:hypothetical protein
MQQATAVTERCETAKLELGGGLEVLVSAALGALEPGQELDVVSEARALLSSCRRGPESPATKSSTNGRNTRTRHAVRGPPASWLDQPRARRVRLGRAHHPGFAGRGDFPTSEARRVAEGLQRKPLTPTA